MRLREPLNVTILNQAEIKYYELLVVLFRNPFIDAMESKKKRKNVDFNEDEEPVIHYVLHGLPCVTLQMQFFDNHSWLYINTRSLPLSITRFKPERGEAINIFGQVFEMSTVCVANTNTCTCKKQINKYKYEEYTGLNTFSIKIMINMWLILL